MRLTQPRVYVIPNPGSYSTVIEAANTQAQHFEGVGPRPTSAHGTPCRVVCCHISHASHNSAEFSAGRLRRARDQLADELYIRIAHAASAAPQHLGHAETFAIRRFGT